MLHTEFDCRDARIIFIAHRIHKIHRIIVCFNMVCNEYVLMSKNLCSHSMSKLIFCEFCGFCVCQKDCGRKILRPYSFAPLCVKQKICPYVLLSKYLCSHSMSKLIFCEFCGFCVCAKKVCGRNYCVPTPSRLSARNKTPLVRLV